MVDKTDRVVAGEGGQSVDRHPDTHEDLPYRVYGSQGYLLGHRTVG